jgi:hypothetical protein
MITDRCGVNLHEGQIVDVALSSGMYTGQIVQINDNSVLDTNGSKTPKMVVVSFAVPVPVDERGHAMFAYKIGNDPRKAKTGKDESESGEPVPKSNITVVPG